MKKLLKQIIILSCLIFLLALPYFVFAQNEKSGTLKKLETVGLLGGYKEAGETTVTSIAGAIVNVVLGLLGIIFVILIIYGGGLWMTAAGNEEQIEKAKKIIKNSLIGLVITVSAFSIYYFIFLAFLNK